MKPTYRYRPKQPQLPQGGNYLAYYLCNTLFGFPIVLYCLFRQMALPMVREDMLKLILFLILPFGWLLTIPVGLLLGFALANLAHRMRFTSNKAAIGKSIGIGCLIYSLPALLSIMIFFPAQVGINKDTVYIFTTLLAALASGCIPPLIFSWTLPKSVEAA